MSENTQRLLIGPFELNRHPAIIAVLDRVVPDTELRRFQSEGAGIFEIRFDLLPVTFEKALTFAQYVRKSVHAGIIGTLRETEENKPFRTAFFQKLIPLVDAIDIEVDAPIAAEVISLAKKKTIIVSHHDFEAMPSLDALLSIADDCKRLGGHIAKVACMARTPEEADRMLAFAAECKHPVIAIAMGEEGARTRIEALRSGSLATYAYTGSQPVAPGQFGVLELAKNLGLR